MFSVQLTSVVAVGAFFFFLFLSVFFTVFQRLWIKKCCDNLRWQSYDGATSVYGGLSLLECQLLMPVLYSSEKLPQYLQKLNISVFHLSLTLFSRWPFKCALTQWAHLSTLENFKHVLDIKQTMCCQPVLRMPMKHQNYTVKLKITWNKRTDQIITSELWQARMCK